MKSIPNKKKATAKSVLNVILNLSVSEEIVLLVEHPELWRQKTQSSTYIFFNKNAGGNSGRKNNVCYTFMGYLAI